MGWVREHLSDENVRGTIVASTYDEILYCAQNMVNSVDVYLYEMNFDLRKYSK